MSDLRNPFAMRNGKVILIEDLTLNERGLNCGCHCPACEGDFIARMGDIKVHHFAHSKEACDEIIAYTSGLYKLIHQILSEGVAFYIPPLVVSCRMPNDMLLDEATIEPFVKIVRKNNASHGEIIVSKGRNISFDNAELFYDNKKHIQAIELSFKDRKMAVKIMPPDTICKYTTVSPHRNMATLVLDFADDAEKIQSSKSEDFEKYLFSENLIKYWIHNPHKEILYQKLLEKNKNEYAVYIERQKRLEEERRIAAIKVEEERKAAAIKAEEARKAIAERQKQLNEERRIENLKRQQQLEAERKIARQQKVSKEKARYIMAYESVKDKFIQQTERIIDIYGNRWIKCEICGEIKTDSEFSSYGGFNHINLGKCTLCIRKRERGDTQ